MAFTSTGGGTWGPAIQLTAPLLPQLPRHRGPSAPVSLSVERIQFTQKPSEHLTVTALSFSAIHARTLLGPQLPPGPESKHCDSEPLKQLCRDDDINVSVLSSATRVQKWGPCLPVPANICPLPVTAVWQHPWPGASTLSTQCAEGLWV